MKKSILSLCLLAILSFSFTACDKEDENNNTNTNTSQTSYSDMIVGNWKVDNVSITNAGTTQELSPESLLIFMYDNGTGLISDNGVTENNDFTWTISDKTLTITHRHGQLSYTITNITSNEATFEGTVLPVTEIPAERVVVHLTRINR